MSQSNSELASTPRWLVTIAARFAGSISMWTMVLLVFGSVGLYTAGFVYSEAIPFVWLAIIGFAITISGFDFDDDDETLTLNESMEIVSEMSPWERRVFVVTVVTVLTGMIGLQITVIGVVSALVSYELSLPLVGIAIAVFGPSVDAWIGRNLGVSLALTGNRLAVVLMEGIAILNNISTEVPKKAGYSVRGFTA